MNNLTPDECKKIFNAVSILQKYKLCTDDYYDSITEITRLSLENYNKQNNKKPAFEIGEKVVPKPVSDEFIIALKNVGARDEFIQAIERENERLIKKEQETKDD